MGFIQRAFTPPGTGGREAAEIMAQASAREAAQVKPAAPPPTLPTAPTPPPGPQQFAPGQAPGAKQKAAVTASTMLGAAATAGQQAKKSLLGQ
jgi:hypothetical protein